MYSIQVCILRKLGERDSQRILCFAGGANPTSGFQPWSQTAAFVYDSQAFLEFIFF